MIFNRLRQLNFILKMPSSDVSLKEFGTSFRVNLNLMTKVATPHHENPNTTKIHSHVEDIPKVFRNN